MEELRKQFEELGRDRAKAQLVMDGQHEQLRHWVSESESRKEQVEQLKKQVREQKRILNAAKTPAAKGENVSASRAARRANLPLAERIAREIQRIPANLGLRRGSSPLFAPAAPKDKATTAKPLNRSIVMRLARKHEPKESDLALQRRAAAQWQDPPTISFLLPVKDPPAKFLEELLASIGLQTATNWEVCLIDGGSAFTDTLATIARWGAREPRIRVNGSKKISALPRTPIALSRWRPAISSPASITTICLRRSRFTS